MRGMVIGSATQKIQTIVELAEDLYERVTELREQVAAMRDTVEDTHDRVVAMETDLEDQRAVVAAIAAEHDIDVDELLDEE